MTDFDHKNTAYSLPVEYFGLHLLSILCDSQQFKQLALYKH